jgi:hypothetical protein
MTIVQPHLVVPDTSQLARLSRDWNSVRRADQRRARDCLGLFAQRGGILVLTLHHLQELMGYENAGVVSERLHFLGAFELVGVVASINGDALPGSIVDIQAREVAAAYHNPGATLLAIREMVRGTLVSFTSGEAVLSITTEFRELLLNEFARQQKRNRELVAISRADFGKVPKLKVRDLLDARALSEHESLRQFAGLHRRLTNEIQHRGDHRIKDAQRVSAEFLAGVAAGGSALLREREPVFRLLADLDVRPDEVTPDMTVGDLGNLATYRKRLALIGEWLGLPWNELKVKVAEDRLPSGVIERAMQSFQQDSGKRKAAISMTAIFCAWHLMPM